MRTDKNALLTFDKINGLLNKNFSVSSNPAILDLGCSDGQLLSIFKAKGYNNLTGAGYDVKAQNNIKIFLKIDFNDLSWSDALKDYKFDVIVSSDVIEHLLNPYNFLTQIKKILKADGVIIFSFPNVHNLRSRIAYLVEGRFCGFFGRNWNSNHMLFDQHIWVPNMHLLKYFLKLNDLYIDQIEYEFGNVWLANTTIVYIKNLSKPINK